MSDRINRVNKLIKEELSQIILKEIDFPSGVLATLTRVETSPNLSESKIYVSFLPEAKQIIAFKQLNGRVWHLQQALNKRLKMRPVPKIIFFIEEETAKAGRVEEILERLKKRKK